MISVYISAKVGDETSRKVRDKVELFFPKQAAPETLARLILLEGGKNSSQADDSVRRYFEQQQKGSSFSSLVKTKTNFFLSLRSRESLLFFHQCECEYYYTSRFPGYLLLARSEFALRVTGVTHIKALLEKRKTIKNNNNTEHKYISSSSSVTLFSQDLFVLSLARTDRYFGGGVRSCARFRVARAGGISKGVILIKPIKYSNRVVRYRYLYYTSNRILEEDHQNRERTNDSGLFNRLRGGEKGGRLKRSEKVVQYRESVKVRVF